jgi:inhibitor of KinA
VRLLGSGDTALVVEFGDTVDRELNARVLALDAAIAQAGIAGVVETVPTFRSLMVHYDPRTTSAAALREAIRPLLDREGGARARRRVWTIPVCYEGGCAPDLDEVAERTGRSREEVVALHAEPVYRVYMLGFLPGFPYLGDLPEPLRLPRRENPRTRVPAGSVAIAISLSAVYPVESPGGWHLIGNTPVTFFDLGRDPPALLAPGDGVRFRPVTADEHAELRRSAALPEVEEAP